MAPWRRQYARYELGMVKISDYQVNYVKLSEDDAVSQRRKTHNTTHAQKLKSVKTNNAPTIEVRKNFLTLNVVNKGPSRTKMARKR